MLAVFPDKRLFQESIYGHLEFLAERASGMTDMPPIVVQHVKPRIGCGADGVEVAGYGFPPVDFTGFISLFDGTFGNAVFPGHIRTFLMTAYTGWRKFAIGINHMGAVLFDGSDSLFGHVRLYFRVHCGQHLEFVLLQRSPRVAFYAASAPAFAKVTNKLFLYQFFAHQYGANFDHHG